jgi:hypothetical protein
MGLMYLFPNVAEDVDHVIKDNDQLRLRTYGLPPIMWGYALAILSVIAVLTISVWGPLKKLLSYNDQINNLIGYSLIAFLILLPLCIIGIFFYEKNIIKRNNTLEIAHKLFFIKVSSTTYKLSKENSFLVKHYLDSPNMARTQGLKNMRGFANKGYYDLYLISEDGVEIQIDRSSRKIDLEKLVKILS